MLTQLHQKRLELQQQINSMYEQPVVEFNQWQEIHAEYGQVVFKISQLEKPWRMIEVIQ
jgi:hypothetical protein